MYKDFNTSWPLNSWSLTEPSGGYQTSYIRLLSRFVEPKGSPLPVQPQSAVQSQSAWNLRQEGSSLEVSGATLVEYVDVFDVRNRKVAHSAGGMGTIRIDMGALPAGLYLVQVRAGSQTASQRLVYAKN